MSNKIKGSVLGKIQEISLEELRLWFELNHLDTTKYTRIFLVN